MIYEIPVVTAPLTQGDIIAACHDPIALSRTSRPALRGYLFPDRASRALRDGQRRVVGQRHFVSVASCRRYYQRIFRRQDAADTTRITQSLEVALPKKIPRRNGRRVPGRSG
jgi:hypothetical protein